MVCVNDAVCVNEILEKRKKNQKNIVLEYSLHVCNTIGTIDTFLFVLIII
jgi:hypothetical protein